MKKLIAQSFLLFVMGVASVGAKGSPQDLPPPPPPPVTTMHVERPMIRGGDPVPVPAIQSIYAAYSKYQVVAMEAGHGNQNMDQFIYSLLIDNHFPGRIQDIVVECGNSLYQPLLDRYIAGGKVNASDIQRVWRNTSQPMCAVSSFYEQLFPLIRRLNQRLAPSKRVRVIAGDVPINWDRVRTRDDLMQAPQDRDENIATIMEKEVLSKHRKALMLFGIDHLYHGSVGDADALGAVGRYERKYPGITFVIVDHTGFGNGTPYERFNNELEQRMLSWPVPSLTTHLSGSWLADILDKTESAGVVTKMRLGEDGKMVTSVAPAANGREFATMVDAYLYLGPRDLLLNETVPAHVLLDKSFVAEMRRRAALMGDSEITDQADPDKVSAAGYSPFYYEGNP